MTFEHRAQSDIMHKISQNKQEHGKQRKEHDFIKKPRIKNENECKEGEKRERKKRLNCPK